jgi:hypothetical protein
MPESSESSSYFRVGDNIELWRVVAYLSVLIVMVMVLEQMMHKTEHALQKYPKYHEMLTKIYRELMILGLLGLGIKFVKETGAVDGYGKNIKAFEVADLIVFISAFALIVQAIGVFSVMRSKNKQMDRDELVNSADLIDLVSRHQVALKQQSWLRRLWPWGRATAVGGSKIRFTTARYEEMVATRTLRHFFLRKHGLPELFPFSKYLRQSQDHQITHMIDIEMSMWILLIFITWVLDLSTVLVEDLDDMVERHALVVMFLAFAVALMLFHAVVTLYYRQAVKKILEAAGYKSHNDMLTVLQMVADEENHNLDSQDPDQALEMMHHVQETHETNQHIKHAGGTHGGGNHGGGGGHGESNCFSHDTGFQVVAMFARGMCGKKHHGHEDDDDDHQHHDLYKSMAPLPKVKIRFFNRLAMHFLVKFLIMLNGFYFAFMCQAVLYEMPEIYAAFGVLACIAVPMPLLINMFFFQPQICRNFVVVSCIFKVDVATLSEVITQFSDSVELRADFVMCLKQSMRDNHQTVEELHSAFLAKDPAGTGYIELEELRYVLRAFGCQISFFRFNDIAKLLFRLKGTQAEYVQIERLLTLAEQEDVHGTSISGLRDTHSRATRYLHSVMVNETEAQRRPSRFSEDIVMLESGSFKVTKSTIKPKKQATGFDHAPLRPHLAPVVSSPDPTTASTTATNSPGSTHAYHRKHDKDDDDLFI